MRAKKMDLKKETAEKRERLRALLELSVETEAACLHTETPPVDLQQSCARAETLSAEMDALLWEILTDMQGQTFHTAKGLTYAYQIRGNELFASRKDKSITRATVRVAFSRAVTLLRQAGELRGPKQLGTFGASYLFPVFKMILGR